MYQMRLSLLSKQILSAVTYLNLNNLTHPNKCPVWYVFKYEVFRTKSF